MMFFCKLRITIVGIAMFFASVGSTLAADVGTDIGNMAPDVEFFDAEGNAQHLSDFKNKWVFLDIWSSNCPPCLDEIPSIQEAYEKHKNDKFEVVGVNIDPSKTQWQGTVKRFGTTYKQFYSPGTFASPIARAFEVRAIPSTWMIDPAGRIVCKGVRGQAVEAALKLMASDDYSKIDGFVAENRVWNNVTELYMTGGGQEAIVGALAAYMTDYPEGMYSEMARGTLISMGYDETGAKLTRAEIGKPAPEISVIDKEGKKHSLKEFRGKWVLLKPWASWCPLCLQAIPAINELDKKYSEHGAMVLGVNMDEEKDVWLASLKKHKSTYTETWLADSLSRDKLTIQYGFNMLPITFLIDPDGKLVARELKEEDLDTALKTVTQGTDQEREEFFAAVVAPAEQKELYNKVVQAFGQMQTNEEAKAEFVRLAKEFIQKYPDSDEALILQDVLPREDNNEEK